MEKKAAKQEKIGQILQKKMNMKSFLPANYVLSSGIAQDIDGSLSKDYMTKAAMKSKRRPNGGGLDAMLPNNGSTMAREGARAGESTTKSKSNYYQSTALTRRDVQISPRGIDTEACSLAAPSTELANYDEQLFSRNQ